MKLFRRYLASIFLFFLISTIFMTSLSKADEEEGALIVANIKGSIPPIKPGAWTPIKIEVYDACGFNWTYFSEEFLNIPGLRWYGKLLVWVIWPKILFRSAADYFGYSSLSFYPEIVEGDPRGWKMKVIPSSVSPTTDGYTHDITLYVWADKTAMDYDVTIGIKCTRYSFSGKALGSSYIYVPVKLEKFNYVEMYVKQPRRFVPPWSTSYVTAVITNKGYYEDTLHLHLECEGGIRAEAEQQQIVIKPGESKEVTFVITTPRGFFEYGRSYEIKVYATSVLNPNRTYLGSFVVMIEGLTANPKVGGFYIFLAMLLLLVLVLIAKAGTRLRQRRVSRPREVARERIEEELPKEKGTVSRKEISKMKLIERIRKEQERQRRRLKL